MVSVRPSALSSRLVLLFTLFLSGLGLQTACEAAAAHGAPHHGLGAAIPGTGDPHGAHNHAQQAGDGFFSNFLKLYTPRRLCMFQEAELIWLHILSDLLIAAAYYSIPVALIVFVRRRRDVVFGWVFWLFAAFILLCGTTHVLGVVNIWQPYYRLDGVIKLVTGVVSVWTAIALWPLIPKALAIPSSAQLEREVIARTEALRSTNEALRRSEERYRLVNQATNDVIWDRDLATGQVVWSNSLEKTFGHRTTELKGSHDGWSELIHPEDRDRVIASVQAAISAGEESWSGEYRFRRADGSYASVIDRAHVSRDERGQPVRVVGAILDQTERQSTMMERERLLDAERKARAEAEEANRLKDEFLATLSHELRTPLSAILGWAQLLARAKPTDTSFAEGVSVIDRNARAQLQLIEDLLDMSRIISGKLHIESRPLNLGEVASRAVEAIRFPAAAKEIRLDVSGAVDPVYVRGDATRLQQVLWNLLSNAMKFTPAGGTIAVEISQHADRAIVTVRDTGIGIEAHFLPHIFERFRQADGSITRRHGGLGLGLSIVQSIVEAHGGTIRAHSDGPGTGTTFTLELPTMEPSAMEDGNRPAPEPAIAPDLRGMLDSDHVLKGLTVLIVDDEADVREFVRRALGSFQARTLGAASAEEALEVLQTERPDVLLIDIGMPAKDGYDLIREIRSRSVAEGGSVPAAALTALARPQDRSRALLAGFNLHISKPVNPTDLVASVASLARL
jgi:PAS domain S-box-containing protein